MISDSKLPLLDIPESFAPVEEALSLARVSTILLLWRKSFKLRSDVPPETLESKGDFKGDLDDNKFDSFGLGERNKLPSFVLLLLSFATCDCTKGLLGLLSNNLLLGLFISIDWPFCEDL